MIIRDAIEADLQHCTDVWQSTQADLGTDPIPCQPLSAHELHTGRLMVAEVDGQVAGFGGTFTRSGVLYLADLFVRPAHQSAGIGRQLLHALCDVHDGPRFTFASADQRARRLYAQFGMFAVEHYHYLDAVAAALDPWATDVELIETEQADVSPLDAAITGRDRTADLAHAFDLGATWYLAQRNQTCVGVVALAAPTWWNPWHPHGARVGPVMARDGADIAAIFSAALSVAARLDVDAVSTFVPSSLAALPALLAAGLEVVDTDLLMASDSALIDRQRYVPTVDTP